VGLESGVPRAEKDSARNYTLVLGRVNTNAGSEAKISRRIRELSVVPMKRVSTGDNFGPQSLKNDGSDYV
jgi:hypothetical protein